MEKISKSKYEDLQRKVSFDQEGYKYQFDSRDVCDFWPGTYNYCSSDNFNPTMTMI